MSEFGKMPAGRAEALSTLEGQVRELLPHIPAGDRIPFLAGMRFAQGFAEYGSGLFRITDDKLSYEKACEQADTYVMTAEQVRRREQTPESEAPCRWQGLDPHSSDGWRVYGARPDDLCAKCYPKRYVPCGKTTYYGPSEDCSWECCLPTGHSEPCAWEGDGDA